MKKSKLGDKAKVMNLNVERQKKKKKRGRGVQKHVKSRKRLDGKKTL